MRTPENPCITLTHWIPGKLIANKRSSTETCADLHAHPDDPIEAAYSDALKKKKFEKSFTNDIWYTAYQIRHAKQKSGRCCAAAIHCGQCHSRVIYRASKFLRCGHHRPRPGVGLGDLGLKHFQVHRMAKGEGEGVRHFALSFAHASDKACKCVNHRLMRAAATAAENGPTEPGREIGSSKKRHGGREGSKHACVALKLVKPRRRNNIQQN